MTAGERDDEQESAPVVAPPGPRTSRTRAQLDDEFSAFAAQHGRDLLRTAWLLCGDAHRAEELTQQALVRTYAAWSRTQDPLAYSRRVLANLRVDTWRRRRREVLTAPEDLPERDTIRVGSDEHARTEDRDQLVRALALLTPRQRRIVVLRHMVGLPEAEVAAELGVSLGTVKSTASRGLATSRAALTEPATTTSQEDAR
jgi:RNA polymerase sigma-70 factor (sigma-E family)